jgi:DNA-binding beta-propeller fold protein YncE
MLGGCNLPIDLMKFAIRSLVVTAFLGFCLPSSFSAIAPLLVEDPIVVPDSKGGFDYLQVDVAMRRFLASHTGNNTLDVFDVDTGKLIKHVPTGKAQGVAVDLAHDKYYVSVSREKIVAVVDRKSLEKTGEIKLAGPADALVLDPKNHLLYVGHDDNTNLWVIDTQKDKIVADILIPEGPEYVIYDPTSDRIFQNIKSNDSLLAVDPASNTIQQRWKTAPAKKPHGLAIDSETKRLFCAGQNGKLAVIDATSGKVITTADIAPGIDQIAFDPEKKRVYCASSQGSVSVVEETADGAVSLGIVKTAPGAKTIAVDPKTHAVWIAYADKEHSYIRRLVPQ